MIAGASGARLGGIGRAQTKYSFSSTMHGCLREPSRSISLQTACSSAAAIRWPSTISSLTLEGALGLFMADAYFKGLASSPLRALSSQRASHSFTLRILTFSEGASRGEWKLVWWWRVRTLAIAPALEVAKDSHTMTGQEAHRSRHRFLGDVAQDQCFYRHLREREGTACLSA